MYTGYRGSEVVFAESMLSEMCTAQLVAHILQTKRILALPCSEHMMGASWQFKKSNKPTMRATNSMVKSIELDPQWYNNSTVLDTL